MATGFPVKANYATGDVLTAANMNDLAGTLNYLDPTAKGDLFPASDGSTLTRLAVGTNGQVLTADSTQTTGMKWATSAGGGKVLQVVYGSSSTNYTNSSTTYANTYTLSITPSASTSKVAFFAQLVTSSISSSNSYEVTRPYNTTTSTAGPVLETSQATSSGTFEFPRAHIWLDSPASTSAQTYTVQIAKGSSGAGDISTAGAPIAIMLMEIGA